MLVTLINRFVVSFFFFSSRRRHTRFDCDWSSDVCSSDLLQGREVVRALGRLPELVERVLAKAPEVERIAERMMRASNVLYLGRGYNFPVALEGALKLKEISYIHAEGYPAAEMKHGPIALIDDLMPVVFLAPKDAVYQKVVSNVEEVK